MKTAERIRQVAPESTLPSVPQGLLGSVADDRINDDPPVRRLSRREIVGRSLLIFGALTLLFGFFQIAVGDITERRAQRSLLGAFRTLMSSGAPLGVDTDGKQTVIDEGKPVAFLEIPALGVRKVVAEGTSGEILKRAPGHLRTSPIPGQPGHSIIVGRRTTYGSPFREPRAAQSGGRDLRHDPVRRVPFPGEEGRPSGSGSGDSDEPLDDVTADACNVRPAIPPERRT